MAANGIGKVEPVEIIDEMQRSYLDYAMSVIVARALPDVRDGLKPVQRRIIFAMHKMGVSPTSHYIKSAKVVGEVLGKYHPHGDQPVYEALVRMAQDFSLRYPLIDGQGNWGSIDGDQAAAMRYTECRLSIISEELLRDNEKNTVDFADNFDGTLKEPAILPSVIPNLLLSGASGIAVGMATNIPPHNLGEVCAGIIHLVDNPESSTEDLMQFVKGPDFPTGAHIYDGGELSSAYGTGRGKIIMRAKAEIEEARSGRYQIIVTEIPYQVNKASLITRIAELVKDKKLEGIADLRDESDRRGMRIVVELKRDARPQAVLNNLYKHTALQLSFPVNMVGLVDGTPQTLTLKTILAEFVKHRQIIVTRRSEFELDEAKKRAHILAGLQIAVQNIDAVIALIKKSKDADEAKINLMRRFKLTEVQALAILDMPLRRLAALERQKIEDELAITRETITYLENLLAHPEKILQVIKDELLRVKEKYSDERKTKIFAGPVGEFREEDLIANEPTIITLTSGGYIKRQSLSSFRSQRRGGKGLIGITTKEEDQVALLTYGKTHDDLLFFTDKGKAYKLKAFDITESSRVSKGQAIINLIDLDQSERVLAILPIQKSQFRGKFVFMITKGGVAKKTSLQAYDAIRRSGIIAINLDQGDELRWVKLTAGDDQIFLISKKGKSIKFQELDVREMGRATRGVRGINLGKGDEVIGMDVLDEETKKADLLVVSEKGIGKKSPVDQWPIQKRGGVGVKAANITEKSGNLVTAHVLIKQDEFLVLTSAKGQVIKLPIRSIPKLSRVTQGVTLMRFADKSDRVTSAAIVAKEIEEESEVDTSATFKLKD